MRANKRTAAQTVWETSHPLINLKLTDNEDYLRILHVDDDVCFLEVSKQILEMEGKFKIDNATSVDEAFQKLGKQSYDAVVSDYEMPSKNGLQFLKELREQGNTIPFAIFTGKGREDVAVKALNLGADCYINKNGSPEMVYYELADAINKTVERKKSAQLLAASESKYRTLVENSLQGLLILQATPLRLVFGNAAVEKILGYSLDELMSLSPEEIMELVYHEDRTVFFKRMENRFRGEPAESCYEFRAVRKDGSVIWMDALSNRVEYEGQPAVQDVFLDINERKKAEERIRRVSGEWSRTFDAISDFVLVLDKDCRIVRVNKAICDLLKKEPEELIGKPCFEVLHGKVGPLPGCPCGEILVTKKTVTKEMSDPKSGKHSLATASPIFDDNGELTGIVYIHKDITEREEAEEKLDKLMNELVMVNEKLNVVGSLTRHDVRNKLCAVTGNAFLLKKRHGDQADIMDGLSKMEQAVKDSMEIFGFAKMYEQLGVEELKYVDAEKTINEAVALFSGLNFKVVNDCHGLSLLADSFLKQLFYNFIDDTRKYGEKTTAIRVYFEKAEQGELRLVYEDDGVGISVEDKLKLFTEGFSTGGSTGFGLFLTKKMMDVYGWQIQEAGEPGKGAKFTITIPRINQSGKESFQIIL